MEPSVGPGGSQKAKEETLIDKFYVNLIEKGVPLSETTPLVTINTTYEVRVAPESHKPKQPTEEQRQAFCDWALGKGMKPINPAMARHIDLTGRVKPLLSGEAELKAICEWLDNAYDTMGLQEARLPLPMAFLNSPLNAVTPTDLLMVSGYVRSNTRGWKLSRTGTIGTDDPETNEYTPTYPFGIFWHAPSAAPPAPKPEAS